MHNQPITKDHHQKMTKKILEGKLPRNKRKLVEAWIEIHRDDLMTDWRLAVSGQNPLPIKPLE